METKDEKVAQLLKRPSSVTGAPLGFFMKMACGNQKPPFLFAKLIQDLLLFLCRGAWSKVATTGVKAQQELPYIIFNVRLRGLLG